mmetsp:Transcript_24715/g.32264  ORF Transcript_24715/g.32264 Transcript_24715/m.32264 type:complete len:83 (-) Transcript_24715:450-698(-)
MSLPANPKTLALYRRILASVKLLEPDARGYYQRFAKGHIMSHDDEENPEHLKFLLGKGEENRVWILKKYKVIDPFVNLPFKI